MNPRRYRKELDSWISKATTNSPSGKRESTRAELEDHYWTAREESQAAGMSEEVAHRQTMKRLGPSAQVGCALTAAYHNYRRHALWSFIMPTSFYVLMSSVAQRPENLRQFHDWPPYMAFNLFFPLLLLIPLFYSFSNLQAFLAWRFDAEHLAEPVAVIFVGLTLMIGVPWWIQYLPRIIHESDAFVCLCGLILSAIGMIILCARLTALNRLPHRMRYALQASLTLTAAILVCPLCLSVNPPDSFYLMSFPFAVLSYFLLCWTLGAIFLCASSRKFKALTIG